MKSKTRAISEGAMMLAITGMLLIMNRQFAGMFETLMFVLSVPITIYTVKYGMNMGITLSVSASLLSFMFATPTSIFYLISSIFIGLAYAFGVLHNWKNGWLLFISVLGNLIVTIITVIIMGAIFGYDIEEEIKLFSELVPDVGSMDIQSIVTIVVFLSYLGIAIMQAMIIHMISIEMMKRFKIKVIQMKNVFDLQFPKWSAVFIVISYIIYFALSYINVDKVIMNIMIVIYCCAMLLAIIDGALTIICYLRLKRKGKGMIFLTLLACFLPVLQNVISIIGVFDIWEQFRRKMKEGVLNEIHRTN